MKTAKMLIANLSDGLLDEISAEYRSLERNRDNFRVRLLLASERRGRIGKGSKQNEND